jgi:uncharacterized protein YbaR (Trm112 family)
MAYTAAYCPVCKRRTLHVNYSERRLSKGKTILAVLTSGVSVPVGLRKDRKNALACSECNTLH